MRAFFLIPGDLQRKTGGYGYDRRVLANAELHGAVLHHVALPSGFPFPSHDEKRETLAILQGLPEGVPLLIDGLAYGAFDAAMLAAIRGPVIALVHHPLAYENGIPPDAIARLKISECNALAHAAAVIVTSGPTQMILVGDYQVPAEKIHVALPGTDAAIFAQGSREAFPCLLGVGTLTPRKAWSVLLAALEQCSDLDWRLTIAGDGPERDALGMQIEKAQLQDRVVLAGEVSQETLEQLYDRADIFVMPSLYEGFGMALTEAIARGLPAIVSDGVVAVQHLPADAVTCVRANDPYAFAAALKTMLDPHRRDLAREKARAAAASLPRWDETARIIIETIRSVAS